MVTKETNIEIKQKYFDRLFNLRNKAVAKLNFKNYQNKMNIINGYDEMLKQIFL